MINLIPPTVKEETRFAKLNRTMVGYLRLVVLLLAVLGGIFGATIFYLDQMTTHAAADAAARKKDIAAAAPFRAQAKDASDRLLAIKGIQASQTRFSVLLGDLAKVLPLGVSIDTITLTGDDSKPVRITITGNSYNAMLAFRDAAAASPRISGVDLETISQDTAGFHAGVVLGFNKGQAK